jgi:hypothetical protein
MASRIRITCIAGRKPGDPRRLGIGDALHAIVGPIGRAIHWPCLKGDGTADLIPGSPCDQARQRLNAIKLPLTGH